MPRRIDDDDEMPRRRRRGAKAAAIEVEEERGLVMRMLLHSPKDMVAGLLAAAAICAILANALFLQAGRHPSPMFGSVVTLPAPQAAVVSPLPRPRPVELVTEPPAIEAGRGEGRRSRRAIPPKTPIPKTRTQWPIWWSSRPARPPRRPRMWRVRLRRFRPPRKAPARAAWRPCSARSPNMATAS